MWRKLPSDMKASILMHVNSIYRSNNISNSNKSNEYSHKPIKLPSFNSKSFTKDNLNELLNELLVESNESKNDDIITEDANDSNYSTLLDNSETVSNINLRGIKKRPLLLKSNPVIKFNLSYFIDCECAST